MARLSREQSRTQTRERIRAAARQEFSRNGFGATTIDTITDTAGYSRGAFYANYKSKQDLLLELMSESHEREIAVWHGLIAHSEDFEALLVELENRFDAYAAQRDWWVLNAELQLEAARHEEVGEQHRAYGDRVVKGLEALFADLIGKSADNHADEDITSAAAALRALAHGLMFEAPTLGQNRAGQTIIFFLRTVLAYSNSKGATS